MPELVTLNNIKEEQIKDLYELLCTTENIKYEDVYELFNSDSIPFIKQVGTKTLIVQNVDGNIIISEIDKNGKTHNVWPKRINYSRKAKVEMTQELFNQIKEYLEEGSSYGTIEKITGVCKDRISEIAHGRDKINHKYKRSTNVLSPEKIEQIKQLLAARCSKIAIEEKTGVSKYYIRKIEKGENVPIDGKERKTKRTAIVC